MIEMFVGALLFFLGAIAGAGLLLLIAYSRENDE